jgi:hypothetical protein
VVTNPSSGQGGQQDPQTSDASKAADSTGLPRGADEASGEWLDKLVKTVDPNILKPSAAAQSSFKGNADGSNDSIRLALEDSKDSSTDTAMMFASDADADQILVCFDTESACKAKRALSDTDASLTIPRTKIIGGRSFFLTKYFRADQASYLLQPWSALAYDKDGTLVSSRRFMLSVKGVKGGKAKK